MADEMYEMDNKKKIVLEKLAEARGIVTAACQAGNIARSTFYLWMDDDPHFKAAVEAVNEAAIDFVESKLFERVNGVMITGGLDDDGEPRVYQQPPSDTAIIFYLKTKAKKRGYVERTELTGADGRDLISEPITVTVINQAPKLNSDEKQVDS